MKTHYKLLQLLFISFFLIPNYLFSQQDGSYGYSVPVKDTIRILVVYAEVDYSANPLQIPLWDSPNNWQVDGNGKTLPPIDAGNLFDPTVPPLGILNGWVTKKYHDASLGEYIVLGDYYPEVIVVPYAGDGNVEYVIDSLNKRELAISSLTTASGLKLEKFDNYNLAPPSAIGQLKNNTQNLGIDVMILIWRNSKFHGGCTQGFGLSGGTTSTLKDMNQGIDLITNFNACGIAAESVDLILAEYLHGIFAGNEWHTASGKGDHHFIAKPHSYSITGQSNSAMRYVNGFDRWFLDWKGSNSISSITALDLNTGSPIASDWSIQNHPTDSFFELRDFSTTGDVIRIKLPHVENTTSLPQYLWLENRLMNTTYDKWYNGGPNTCSDDNNGLAGVNGTPGLYAYIQVGRELRSGSNIYAGLSGAPQFASWFYPFSAEGNYDFHYCLDSLQSGSAGCDFGNANYPIDKSLSQQNPFTGHSDLYSVANTDKNSTLLQGGDLIQAGFSEVINGNIVHNLNGFGDWEDAFTDDPGYNKINIGSNPSPVPVMTRRSTHSDGSIAQLGSYDNTTIWLNGISITILAGGSQMVLKITWNNFDVDNDVRWCGKIVLQNDINDSFGTISKINLNPGNTILLDQGKSAQKPNGTLQPDNTYIFADPTILTLESGTITTIQTGSELKVVNGSTLHINLVQQ